MIIPETLAEVLVTYSTCTRIAAKDRFKNTCSADVAKVFRQIWPSFEHVEYFYILLLNRANHVLGYHQVSKGGISGTVVDQKVIFQVALKCQTSNIMGITTLPEIPIQVAPTKRLHKKLKRSERYWRYLLLTI